MGRCKVRRPLPELLHKLEEAVRMTSSQRLGKQLAPCKRFPRILKSDIRNVLTLRTQQ